MKNAEYLAIVFENCEDIIIPIDRAIEFNYGDVKSLDDEIFSDGNYYRTNYLKLKISYQDESELKYNDVDYEEPLGMFIGNPLSNNVEDRPNILGRLLNHHDVVGIWLLEGDQEPFKAIYVPWGEDEYTNTCMSVKAENGIIEMVFSE